MDRGRREAHGARGRGPGRRGRRGPGRAHGGDRREAGHDLGRVDPSQRGGGQARRQPGRRGHRGVAKEAPRLHLPRPALLRHRGNPDVPADRHADPRAAGDGRDDCRRGLLAVRAVHGRLGRDGRPRAVDRRPEGRRVGDGGPALGQGGRGEAGRRGAGGRFARRARGAARLGARAAPRGRRGRVLPERGGLGPPSQDRRLRPRRRRGGRGSRSGRERASSASARGRRPRSRSKTCPRTTSGSPPASAAPLPSARPPGR